MQMADTNFSSQHAWKFRRRTSYKWVRFGITYITRARWIYKERSGRLLRRNVSYIAQYFTPLGGGSEQVNKSRNTRSHRRVRSANICGGRKLHKYVSTNVWTREICQHTANVTECTLYDATIQDRCVALVIFVLETSMVGCHVTNRWAVMSGHRRSAVWLIEAIMQMYSCIDLTKHFKTQK